MATSKTDAKGTDAPKPPTAARVARRAVALMMLSGRAVLERDHGKSDLIDANYDKLQEWIAETGVSGEFEKWERDALRKRPGELDRQAAINAMWRIEGLEVLAWALGKHPLPRYDAMSSVDDVWAALGFMRADATTELLATATLRPAEELDAVRRQFLAYHWRLRQFGLKPEKMDFRAFAATCWFGGFDHTPFDLIDDELALGGKRLDEADADLFGLCQSIAVERHRAANWLCWGPTVYSNADAST